MPLTTVALAAALVVQQAVAAALPAVLLLAVVSPLPARAAQPFPRVPVSERGLVGTIGTHRVRMMLSCFGENEIAGSYYFDMNSPFARNWMTDVTVSGKVDANGRFRMEESAGVSLLRPSDDDAAEDEPDRAPDDLLDNFGVMTGTITIDGPTSRPAVRLVGTWSLPDGSKPLPLSLAEVPIPRNMRIVAKTFGRSDERIRAQASATYPSLVGQPAFERQIMRTIRQSVSVLRVNADQDVEGVDPEEYSTLDIDYEVTYASPAVVSVMFRSHSWYTVFVTHDRLEQWGHTYDLRRGRALMLRDLFGPNYRRVLGPKVREAVAGTYWSDVITGTPQEIAGADFYLVDGGVILLFDVDHSLGGVVEVFLPKTL